MTIEEVLAAEIPEGKFEYAMRVLIQNHYPAVVGEFKPSYEGDLERKWLTEEKKQELIKRNESLCAAFTALYEISKGREPDSFYEEMAYALGRDEGKIAGRAEAFADVEKIIKENGYLPPFSIHPTISVRILINEMEKLWEHKP